MFPKKGLSNPPVPDAIEVPYRDSAKIDYALGNPDLYTDLEEDRLTLWTGKYVGGVVTIQREGGEPHEILHVDGATEFGFCFDAFMRPVTTWAVEDKAYVRYYNYETKQEVTVQLPEGARTPRIAFDLKSWAERGVGEVVVGYFKDHSLWVSLGTQKFLKDRVIGEYKEYLRLEQVQMGDNRRLHFIVYQMVQPEDVETVDPNPKSIHHMKLSRRQAGDHTAPYSGPVVEEYLFSLQSDGWNMAAEINQPNARLPSPTYRRIYPMILVIQKELIDKTGDNELLYTYKRFNAIGEHMVDNNVTKAQFMTNAQWSVREQAYVVPFDIETVGYEVRKESHQFISPTVKETTYLSIGIRVDELTPYPVIIMTNYGKDQSIGKSVDLPDAAFYDVSKVTMVGEREAINISAVEMNNADFLTRGYHYVDSWLGVRKDIVDAKGATETLLTYSERIEHSGEVIGEVPQPMTTQQFNAFRKDAPGLDAGYYFIPLAVNTYVSPTMNTNIGVEIDGRKMSANFKLEMRYDSLPPKVTLLPNKTTPPPTAYSVEEVISQNEDRLIIRYGQATDKVPPQTFTFNLFTPWNLLANTQRMADIVTVTRLSKDGVRYSEVPVTRRNLLGTKAVAGFNAEFSFVTETNKEGVYEAVITSPFNNRILNVMLIVTLPEIPMNALLTENDEPILTESNDFIVTEDD